jgi:hypothetical protein
MMLRYGKEETNATETPKAPPHIASTYDLSPNNDHNKTLQT